MGGSQVDVELSTPAQALQNDYPGLGPGATNIQQPSEEATHEELYPTFSYRIRESFTRISELPTSPVMRRFVKQKDAILSALDMYTPNHVREMFDQDDPPSFQDLVKLEWENDTRVGVYTKTIFEPNAAGKPRLERPHFTYVGSATQREGGLAARKRKHNSPSKKEKKSFRTYLVHGDVKRTRKFGVLISVPTNGLNHREFMTIRQICIVAEAVFADMLGGYSDHVKDTRLHQSVYGDARKIFSWRGACSHFCLLEGVRILKSMAIKGQRLIDAMFKYMKLVTDKGAKIDATLVNTSVTSPSDVAYNNADDDHGQSASGDALLLESNSDNKDARVANHESSMKVHGVHQDVDHPKGIEHHDEIEDSDGADKIEDYDDPCDVEIP